MSAGVTSSTSACTRLTCGLSANRSRSSGTRLSSNSTATSLPASGSSRPASSSVSTPSPGPTSITWSSGRSIAASAMRGGTERSVRKFCPSLLRGRKPASRSVLPAAWALSPSLKLVTLRLVFARGLRIAHALQQPRGIKDRARRARTGFRHAGVEEVGSLRPLLSYLFEQRFERVALAHNQPLFYPVRLRAQVLVAPLQRLEAAWHLTQQLLDAAQPLVYGHESAHVALHALVSYLPHLGKLRLEGPPYRFEPLLLHDVLLGSQLLYTVQVDVGALLIFLNGAHALLNSFEAFYKLAAHVVYPLRLGGHLSELLAQRLEHF